MSSQVSPIAWSRGVTRTVVMLCAFVLLATVMAIDAAPAGATDLTGAISSNRSGQLYAETLMLSHDRRLAALFKEQKATRKELRRAKASLRRAKASLAQRNGLLAVRRARRAQAELAYATALQQAQEPPDEPPDDPTAEPPAEPTPPPGPTLAELARRVDRARASTRAMKKRMHQSARWVKAQSRAVAAKKARLRSLRQQRRVTISQRESAEAVLASRILQMTDLAARRAENQSSVSYAYQTAFSWPTPGRVVQRYGCTGYHLNPRRGSCAHFHDGVDIVNGHGTSIRSIGVGAVAYAGWNPWDEGRRAWIIVIAHPDGWVSRYGHLTPTSHVRAGDTVFTGQIIGRMGNTGMSTGTHLHFELLRGGRDVNPTAYMPAGVIRVDKTTTKKGKALAKAKAKKQKAKARIAKARRRTRQQAEAEAQALAAVVAACDPALLAEVPAEDVHEISYMTDFVDVGACLIDDGTAGDPSELDVLIGRERLVTRPSLESEEAEGLALARRTGMPFPA